MARFGPISAYFFPKNVNNIDSLTVGNKKQEKVMADRNKFEEMLERLINEDKEGAEELFHEIVVEKSRDIYESLLEDDEEVDEADDEEVDESDEDLDESDDEEVDESEEEVEEGFDLDEFEVEADDDMMGGDPADDMLGDIEADDDGEESDMDGDEEGEEDLEDRVIDIEDELDELKAEFDKILGGEDDMGMEPGDDDDQQTYGDDDDDDEESKEEFGYFESEDEEVDEAEDEEVDESEDEDDDDDDMKETKKTAGEQMREYVEKVQGGELGSKIGGDNGANTKSAVAGKNDMGGTTQNILRTDTEESGESGAAGGQIKGSALNDQSPKDMNTKNVNVPGGKAGKTGFKKSEPGHGAEKKGKPESSDKSTSSTLNKVSTRAK